MTPMLTWNWPDTAIEIVVIIVLSLVVHWVIKRAIRIVVDTSVRRVQEREIADNSRGGRILAHVAGLSIARHAARTQTVGSLLRNINSVVVLVICVLMILRALGIPLTPLIASAGIGGVAIAFGAQSLVKDYLSGIFMILEDQYGVGDFVDFGDAIGTIEEVGLRVTRLRDESGQIWYVRNGQVLRVGNRSQGWSTASVIVPVGIHSNPARVLSVLEETMDRIYADDEFSDVLLEPPSVAGIDTVVAGAMNARIFAKCAPNEHYAVQRAILMRSVEALRHAGIRGPDVPAFSQPETGPEPGPGQPGAAAT